LIQKPAAMAQGVPVRLGDDIRITRRSRRGCWACVKTACMGLCSDELGAPWFEPAELTIRGEEWSLGGFISYGAEGQTYKVTRKSDGKKFAAKFVSVKNSREVELVQALPPKLVAHKNFVSYEMIVLGVERHFSPACDILFMEYVPNGELFDMIVPVDEVVQQGVSLSASTCRRFMWDIIRGMAQCYRVGLTHRDLKPENLLIDHKGSIVIIDLGHAKYEAPPAFGPGPPTMTEHGYGTRDYCAPEVFRVARASASRRADAYNCELADVWSVGVIAFVLHAGRLPFLTGITRFEDVAGPDNEQLWNKLERVGMRFPDGLKRFLNALFRQDPHERPSFAQLEAAMAGEAVVLDMFPGLQWLAEPVNNQREFIAELRARRKDLKFDSFQPRAPGV